MLQHRVLTCTSNCRSKGYALGTPLHKIQTKLVEIEVELWFHIRTPSPKRSRALTFLRSASAEARESRSPLWLIFHGQSRGEQKRVLMPSLPAQTCGHIHHYKLVQNKKQGCLEHMRGSISNRQDVAKLLDRFPGFLVLLQIAITHSHWAVHLV